MNNKKYKLDLHLKNYITKELYNYEFNVNKLKEIQDDILYSSGSNSDGQPKGNKKVNVVEQKAEKLIESRTVLIITRKIQNIKAALKKLDEEEQEIVDLIFFKGNTQVYLQMHNNISKDQYYNIKNKMIYLTAREYGEI